MELAFIIETTGSWPLFAAGAVALTLLLVAHLRGRRAARRISFPATRLLVKAAARSSSAKTLRAWLLFAVRATALLLLLTAFIRPMLLRSSDERPRGSDAPGIDAAIILDASATMQRTIAGRTIFDRAQARAVELLNTLDPARDRATLIIAGVRTGIVLPRVSANIPALIAAADATTATRAHADLGDAIRAGASAVSSAEDRRERRIVVLSDMNKQRWAEARGTLVGSDVPIILEDVAPGDEPPLPTNLGIVSLASTPAAPVAGEPTRIVATIQDGSGRGGSAIVQFGLRDRQGDWIKLGIATAQVQPGGAAQASVPFDGPANQSALVRAELTDDSFALDNTREAAIQFRPALRFAVITSANEGINGAAIVAAAIQASTPDATPPRVLRPDELSPAALADLDGAIVVEAGAIGESAMEALASMVAREGTVLWIADSDSAAASFNRFAERVIPGAIRLGDPESAPAQLSAISPDDAMLDAFASGPVESSLRSVRFKTTRKLITGAGASTSLLLTTQSAGDGASLAWAPALQPASGVLAVLATDLSPGASDFPKSAAFPVILNQIIRRLVPVAATTATVQLHPSDNLDPRETDLSTITPAEALTCLTGREPVPGEPQPEPSQLVATSSTRLAPFLAGAAAGLLALESLLATVWPIARIKRKESTP